MGLWKCSSCQSEVIWSAKATECPVCGVDIKAKKEEKPSALAVAAVGKSLGDMFCAVLERADVENPDELLDMFKDNLGVLVKLACPEIDVVARSEVK